MFSCNKPDTHEALYRVSICDTEFIFRPLSTREFRKLLASAPDGLEFEDEVCRLCTISPEGYDFERSPSGVSPMLCLAILQVSGFLGDDAQLIQQARMQAAQSLDDQMMVVIMMAFPQYKLEEIENWSRRRIIEMYARAEWSLALRGMPIQIQDQQVPQQPAPTRGGRAGAKRNRKVL